jgi:hypothetical protein
VIREAPTRRDFQAAIGRCQVRQWRARQAGAFREFANWRLAAIRLWGVLERLDV